MRPQHILVYIGLTLLAAPLAAQEPIIINQQPPVVNLTTPPPQVFNEITVMTDSAMIANLNRNLEALRLQIAAQECNTCGSSNVVRAGQGVLVLIAAFMAWQVKKIADKPNGDDVHHEGDTNVTVPVTVEPHDHGRRKDHDDSESGS
ncbi:MAG: hypothetical protein KAJ42_10140 [Gemmatimonadetes bacterium]|nr:hypothetical protein [Gemmatimonadota bacterium]